MKKAAKPVEEPHSITMTMGPVETQMSWVPSAVGDLGMENTSQVTLQDRLSLSTEAKSFGDLSLQLSLLCDRVWAVAWQMSLPHYSSQLCWSHHHRS